MRLIFLGSGEFAVPSLRWLVQSEHEVAMVYTQPARAAGRGRKQAATPVKTEALKLGLTVREVENMNDTEVIAAIQVLGADLGLAIAFGQKLSEPLLATWPRGCLNLHASLLPKYRGAAPINWAVVRGEERTGCSVFRINHRMDAGPVLSSRWTLIKPEETAGELHDRLAGIGVDALRTALALYADNADVDGTPQDESKATKAPKLKKSDGVIRFHQPASIVVRHILGMTPWPGASTNFQAGDGRWEKVQIARARCAETNDKPTTAPGMIDARLYVAASDAFIEVLEIKPSSGRIMTWRDYVNGRRVKPGDRLGPVHT